MLLDSAETVVAFASAMSDFLRTSEITETRAFVRSVVKAILVRPGQAAGQPHRGRGRGGRDSRAEL